MSELMLAEQKLQDLDLTTECGMRQALDLFRGLPGLRILSNDGSESNVVEQRELRA